MGPFFIAYNIVMHLVAITALPLLWICSRVSGKWTRVYSRYWLSPVPFDKGTVDRKTVVIHGVSVGEVNVARTVAEALAKRRSDVRIIVSSSTPAGIKVASNICGDDFEVAPFPFDVPFAIKRCLQTLEPDVFVILETEIWPNFLAETKKRGTSVMFLNGRISERTANALGKIPEAMRFLLEDVRCFCMRYENDARRIERIGARPEAIHVTGNIKCDGALFSVEDEVLEELRATLNLAPEDTVFVAGSVRSGEEEQVLRAYKALKDECGNAIMVLAPRHLRRTARLEEALNRHGIPYEKRTALTPSIPRTQPVVVLDTLGELSSVYGLATIAFVGGTFVPKIGGHNILEPAALGVSTVFGLCVSTVCEEAALLVTNGGGRQVADGDEFAKAVVELARSPELRRTMGERGRQTVRDAQGAMERNLAAIDELLSGCEEQA
ncbi:3-deoxy-D-manno-octulosonic acid transferase [Candidatus Hydrogenedentota bacterium]